MPVAFELAAGAADEDVGHVVVLVLIRVAHVGAVEHERMIQDRPVAILGFLELEAHQADRATVEQLIEKTGLPREAFGQLLLHARLDLVHAKDLHRVLDLLPLKPHHEQLIGLSALQSMLLVTDAFLDAIEDASVPLATRP